MWPQVNSSVTWLPEDGLEGGQLVRGRVHHRYKIPTNFFPLLRLVTIIFLCFRWTHIMTMDPDIKTCYLSKFLLDGLMPVFLLRIKAPLR